MNYSDMAENRPLEPQRVPETIEDVYIVIRAHFEKIAKNCHFRSYVDTNTANFDPISKRNFKLTTCI